MPDDTTVATLEAVNTDFIEPTNDMYKKAGDLIEEWANDYGTVPRGTEQIKRVLLTRGDVKVPDRIKSITIVHDTLESLHIVCPPKEMIEAGKKSVKDKKQYPLLEEYFKQCDDDQNNGRLKPEDFLMFRLGEYCLSQCM